MTVKTTWYIDDLKRRARSAALDAINETNDETAKYTRAHHPGWKNRTGEAERSIVFAPADMIRPRLARGRVGSTLWRFLFLELKHGSALRNAGDVEFPKLADRLRRKFGA